MGGYSALRAMKIRMDGGLPFVTVSLRHRGAELQLDHVLLDTGSAGTVFSADRCLEVGIVPEATDPLRRIAGVGGAEYVFEKVIDEVILGHLSARHFRSEIGALDYGFSLDGIIGIDFLLEVGALIDLKRLAVNS